MVLKFFEVTRLPDQEFDREAMMELFGKNAFMIGYDFALRTTILAVDERSDGAARLGLVVPGMELSDAKGYGDKVERILLLSVFREAETMHPTTFSDVFSLRLGSGFLGFVFRPLGIDEIGKSKKLVEGLLEKKVVRETLSVLNGSVMSRMSNSQQRDTFSGSEERMLLAEILESLNLAVLSGMHVYEIYAVIIGPEALEEYTREKLFVMDSVALSTRLRDWPFEKMPRSLPVGIGSAKNFVNFYGVRGLAYSLKTAQAEGGGAIKIGTFLEDGVHDTGEEVRVDPSLLNLGFVLTGLPGSGKTMEAMSVIDSVLSEKKGTRVVVLAPTDEWDGFALDHGMHLVKIYQDGVPINFFRCAEGVDASVFYEDLAMLISSSSDAGPYRNPMEKCLLNAFKNVYHGDEREPDPVLVYKEIEEAVIRLHAKRTNVGVKYTKHGENIRSALENLRSIIRRPEYSSRKGIRIEDVAESGVVFNISGVSNKIKPSIYALLLNQAYTLANAYDTNGDDDLRLLVCLEESQTILGQRGSAAVEDLTYRIQDFRKKGVGLVLLTHNADDIDDRIRRLCQLKLYLKQSPDAADAAAGDLMFTYADNETVARKLKHLDSRTGAFGYLVKKEREKVACDSVFLRTADYGPHPEMKYDAEDTPLTEEYMKINSIERPALIDAKLRIEIRAEPDSREMKLKGLSIGIYYLLEPVVRFDVASLHGGVAAARLVNSRVYDACLENASGRILSSSSFTASGNTKIKFIL